MMKRLIIIIVYILSLSNCKGQIDKSKMLGDDIRLFQGTKAWNLAKAVESQDTSEIRNQIVKKKVPIDFKEPKFGQTLLMLSVSTNKYHSAEALLKLSANPNLPDNYDGTTAIITASGYGPNFNKSTDLLMLLLNHGGNPNSIEVGKRRDENRTRKTPLIIAAGCCLEKTKLLVNAGANIDFKNEFEESAIKSALYGGKDREKNLRYLLIERKASLSSYSLTGINGEVYSLSKGLRAWVNPLDSEEYKIKMEIVEYLKTQGDDYWKTSIPKHLYKNYSKEYLEKY